MHGELDWFGTGQLAPVLEEGGIDMLQQFLDAVEAFVNAVLGSLNTLLDVLGIDVVIDPIDL